MNDKPNDHHERLPTDDDDTVALDPVRDEKRDTKELPRVIDNRPQDVPAEGETMSEEPTLHSIVARIEAREKLSDERWATVKAQLGEVHAEIGTTNARVDAHDVRFGTFMAPEAIVQTIRDEIRTQWETVDQAYTRAETLMNSITSQFAEHALAQGQLAAAMEGLKAEGRAHGDLLNVLASGQSILLGYDLRDPNAKQVGTSVVVIATKALETAQAAETDVANMRVDAAAVANQLRGWLAKAETLDKRLTDLDTRLEKREEVDARWQSARELLIGILRNPLKLALTSGSFGGMGVLISKLFEALLGG